MQTLAAQPYDLERVAVTSSRHVLAMVSGYQRLMNGAGSRRRRPRDGVQA
jgi:hypothetical protein